jgi:hypothetical protein
MLANRHEGRLENALVSLLASAILLTSASVRAANPAKRACFATCRQILSSCKAEATSERDAARAACPEDPAQQRACRAAAKSAFKTAKKACKSARKECKGCCKRTGAVCTVPRPSDLPSPFETGIGSTSVSLDAAGCLPGGDNVILSTDRAVVLELDDDTCFTTFDGDPVTGAVTLRVDDAGGILAQGSPGFLQGVIRLVVDASVVAGRFVALDRSMKVRVELDDGTLPGIWEAVAWVDGDTYAAGPATGGTRPEVRVTVVPIEGATVEEFEYWGGGPVGIRYVRPPAPAAISPLGGAANTVVLDLLQAGLAVDFPTSFPFLCTWRAVGPQTAEILAAQLVPGDLPHGQTTVHRNYQATVRVDGAPRFEIASPFLNRLTPSGFVCDGQGGGQPFNEALDQADGGSPEEADLQGPYDGRIVLLFGGREPANLATVIDTLPTAFPSPSRAVIRTFSQFSTGFSLIADVFDHPESVRLIATVFPSEWRYEFDDRHAVVNTTPLFFDFVTGLQGWAPTDAGGPFDSAVHLERDTGVVKLDGTDSPDDTEPNSWISRTVTIPAAATTLQLDVSAHDRAGANALYRVRLTDGGGAPHTLIDWTEKSGIEGDLTFSTVTTDITAFAGQSVTLFLEQDGNAPGEHEQIYYDNVWIRP